jgi:hypothetical protein
MPAMLPPIIGGIQAAFGVGTKMCFILFTTQNFANFLFFKILQTLHSYTNNLAKN